MNGGGNISLEKYLHLCGLNLKDTGLFSCVLQIDPTVNKKQNKTHTAYEDGERRSGQRNDKR